MFMRRNSSGGGIRIITRVNGAAAAFAAGRALPLAVKQAYCSLL